jgi:hypothetical protein
MKPRVFVSSTYYDLRHVRERIEKFIDDYGFESVLFESDKVTYEHNKSIDSSAYNEVTLCNIMILIVGGRYGTPSTSLSPMEDQKKYDVEYVSITLKEFDTALKRNIPIFIFIDKNVYSEYQTYKENQDFLDNYEKYSDSKSGKELKFKFAHVDSINIFKFIDSIKAKPIKTFDQVEEVENYLQNQLAGMFYLYLDNLQKQKEVEKVLDTVSELNNISLRMNEMLNSVGKKILGSGDNEYQEVIRKQFEMIVDFFVDNLYEKIEVEDLAEDSELTDDQRKRIAELIYELILIPPIKYPDKSEKIPRKKFGADYNEKAKNEFNMILQHEKIPVKFEKILATNMHNTFRNKVKPFINKDEDKNILIDKIFDQLWIILL